MRAIEGRPLPGARREHRHQRLRRSVRPRAAEDGAVHAGDAGRRPPVHHRPHHLQPHRRRGGLAVAGAGRRGAAGGGRSTNSGLGRIAAAHRCGGSVLAAATRVTRGPVTSNRRQEIRRINDVWFPTSWPPVIRGVGITRSRRPSKNHRRYDWRSPLRSAPVDCRSGHEPALTVRRTPGVSLWLSSWTNSFAGTRTWRAAPATCGAIFDAAARRTN